jgi:hypothetical protein
VTSGDEVPESQPTFEELLHRPRATEPARARTTPRDGLEVPFESGRVTFPAVVTQTHPQETPS